MEGFSDPIAILNPHNGAPRRVPVPVRVVGIDLGTTNSSIAETVWDSERPSVVRAQCLEVEQDTPSGRYTHYLVPSTLALHDGKEWVGEGAKLLYGRANDLGLEVTRNIFLECKNDIGVRRTYHKAPEGYRCASEVSSRILRFLMQEAQRTSPDPVARTVVTVPASFQAAQRLDTVRAAKLAGIELSPGDLLDEPVAAFIDYLFSYSNQLKGLFDTPKNLLVFDFGGGTCDVAIFRIRRSPNANSLDISPRAVSRYHRLGGGDIDRAVLYEVLLPQLIEQNGLERFSLTFEDKKNRLEPSFIGVAEALKLGLCNELARVQRLNQAGDVRKDLTKVHPGVYYCTVGLSRLELRSPALSLEQFESLLKPFLDSDFLYARETEYRLTCSVFAPIQDALDRSGLSAAEIDLCLLVGGSSLIPQVQSAVDSFFENAKTLTLPDRDATVTAVARGAAYHSLALTLFGRGLFGLAAFDSMSIRTSSGTCELIAPGTSLPYPTNGERAKSIGLAVPATSLTDPVPLLVEIIAGEASDERILFTQTWQIPAPVSKGDRLRLEYNLDENQVLEFRLTLEEAPDAAPFVGRLENPLTNVVNPQVARIKIQEAEEELRTGRVSREGTPGKIVEIAKLYAELQQNEKAISYLRQALRLKGRPDAYILNLLGIYHGENGDFDSQEKCYRESIETADNPESPLFNLALSLARRGNLEAARSTIDERHAICTDGPGLTVAAQIAEASGDRPARDVLLNRALSEFGPVEALDDWALGWLLAAVGMAGRQDLLAAAQTEQRRRTRGGKGVSSSGSLLPDSVGTLRKR